MSAGDSTTNPTGFATRLKESVQSAISTRRPWSVLLDPTSLSLPSSISDATTRLFQNLTHFRFNYSLLLLFIFFLGLLISRPISNILVFLVLLAAWFFLFFSRDEPLSVASFVVEDGVALTALGIATLVAVVVTGVGWNVVVWVLVGFFVVSLHAVVRSTDDLVTDDRQSPYGPLMSDDHDPQGTYTII
ncbi:hypothetical protein L484_016338 [Morus notabilis]|uniref:PRA1 family protein n=1 Tax=Morus notabilis TaxID=981085 RepID=W9QDZ4_9ROSA|nr:PRA1 family protein D [Morus notabilis]EXB29849.1 hypothetical protein L484_016338 [Morus notabilis]